LLIRIQHQRFVKGQIHQPMPFSGRDSTSRWVRLLISTW
jgi:hypothetical protein